MNIAGHSIAELLGRPIAYHRVLVEVTASVTAAVFLSQALHWAARSHSTGGWFAKTREEWTEETALTRFEQESARKKLRHLKILREEMRGLPAKIHFSIDFNVLEQCLENSLKLAGIQPPSRSVYSQQGGCEVSTKVAVDRQIEGVFEEDFSAAYKDRLLDSLGKTSKTSKPTSESKNPSESKNLGASVNIKNENNNSSADRRVLKDEFEIFWAVYPKRQINPKAPAFESYVKARTKRGATADEILAGAKVYAQIRHGQDSTFTTQAVTWLNQARWADDYSLPSQKPKRVGGGLC